MSITDEENLSIVTLMIPCVNKENDDEHDEILRVDYRNQWVIFFFIQIYLEDIGGLKYCPYLRTLNII